MTKANESHRRARLLFGAMCAGLWFAGAPASAAPALEWQAIGPAGGTVLSLAVDPVDPHTAYAACGAGGLYKTVDAGNSWTHSDTGGSGLLPSVLTHVKVDPTAPGTVYAIGAPVVVGSTEFGGGFFKSTDGGATWDGAGNGIPPPLAGQTHDVDFAPRSPGTLYAAAGNRVFKSIDGAATWTDSGDGLRLGSTVNTVAVDPNQPSILIAGTSLGIFRSVDAGATWLPVQQGIGRPPIVVLAFDPRTPGLVYAGAQVGNPSAPPGLYVSADDGATWSAQPIAAGNPPVTCLAVAPAGDRAVFACVGDAGVYKAPGASGPWQPAVGRGLPAGAFASLAIAPAQPSLLYAGTGAANLGPAVYRSLTDGATWRPYGNGIEAVDLTSFAVDPSHQGTVYAGSAGGVQKTADGGATWIPANSGLGATLDVGALVVDPLAPATLYVDTDGGFFASHDGAAHWLRPGKPFPGVPPLVADPVSPATVYTSSRFSIYRSRNGGATWVPIGPEAYTVEAFAVSPAAPANLYMTAAFPSSFNELLASQNGGPTFTTQLTVRADTPLLVADPRAPETIYYKIGDTSYAQPGLYKSTDGGRTATLVIPGDNAALSLVIDPANPAVLYAGYWSGVLVSRDGGATWGQLGRLPAPLPVDQLALAPGGFLIARVRGNGLYRLAL